MFDVRQMTPLECLEDDLRIAKINLEAALSNVDYVSKNVASIDKQIRDYVPEPSKDASRLMRIIGHNCKLTSETDNCFSSYRIEIKIPNWPHDKHGYRAQMQMRQVHEMGYYLGCVEIEEEYSPTLRFFKV